MITWTHMPRHFFLFIFFLLITFNFYADDPLDDFPTPLGAQWAQYYHAETSGRSIIAIPTGYMVAGRQVGAVGPGIDYWATIVRFDLNGNVVNTKTFHDETDHNEAFDILASFDGATIDGYIVTGTRHTEYTIGVEEYDLPDIWLMKIGTDLEKDWEYTFGNPFSDYGYATFNDGSGYVVTGKFTNPNESAYLVRTDESGVMTWEASWETDPRWEFMPVTYDSAPAPDGGLVVATDQGLYKLGTYTSTTRPSHTAEWSVSTSENLQSVIAVTDGYVATGSVEITGNTDHTDLVLLKVNTSGSIVWRHTFGRSAPALGADGMNDSGSEVIQTADGGYAVIGTTESYAWHGGNDLWLIKTDSTGNMEWDIVAGDADNDFGKGIVQDSANDLAACGTTYYDDGLGGGLTNWIYTIKFSSSYTSPNPSFTYSPSSPFFIQESIQFDATDSTPGGAGDSIILYEWDFGDGSTGTGTTPEHTYITPGIYTVTLYITDTNGIRRETSQTVVAEGLETQWERIFSEGNTTYYDIVKVEGSNVLLIGLYKIGLSNSNSSAMKINATGNTLWSFNYPDDQFAERDGSRTGVLGHDGNYVILGFRETDTVYRRDIRVIKVNAETGEEIWDKIYDYGIANDDGFDIHAVPAGGYIIVGYASIVHPPTPPATEPPADIDVWLIKIDEDGDEEWSQTYSGIDTEPLRGVCVIPSNDGGYLIISNKYGFSYDNPIVAIKTNSSGVEQWRYTIPHDDGFRHTGGEWGYQTASGDYVIAGMLNNEYALMTIDEDGTTHDAVTWGPAHNADTLNDADMMPDGGYIMVGSQYVNVTDYGDMYIVETDSQGNVAWERTSGGPGMGGEYATAVAALNDGSILILHHDQDDDATQGTRLLKIGGNHAPAGDFTFDPIAAVAGEPVYFTSDVEDEDGTITHMTWQFGTGEGDPVVTASSTIEHTYTSSGTYTVTLRAYDNSAGELVVTHNLTVTGDVVDNCPDDPYKIDPGICGCGVPDTDTDGDGTLDCLDNCPDDPGKTEPGACGCGIADTDTDGDGTADCNDGCPDDIYKTAPGDCGCGVVDTDTDSDGTADCIDECPEDPDKIAAGTCGCGVADTDTDSDGTPDCVDNCPDDPSKTEPGTCGCGVADVDTDGDGTLDCLDSCPEDADKTEPAICGCGTPDVDTDGDATLDCLDGCPDDPEKTEPGRCGCGVADTDTDGDGTADCHESGPDGTDPDYSGNGDTIPDSEQDFVSSLDAYDDSGYVTIASADGTVLSGVTAEDNPAPADPDAPDVTDFPYGFFNFTVSDITPGSGTTVTIYLPSGAAPSTYWKYGPTTDDPTPHWYEFLYDADTGTGAEFSGNVITLHFVDGLRGDDDLDAANGIIVDIGAPGTPTPSSDSNGGGGGGGCFISDIADL